MPGKAKTRKLTVRACNTVYQLKLYSIAHVTPHPPQCAHWGTFLPSLSTGECIPQEKAEAPKLHWLLLEEKLSRSD